MTRQKYSPGENGLVDRLEWIINLRWATLSFIFLTVFLAHKFFGLSLHIFPICLIALLIALYNLFFLLGMKRLKSGESLPRFKGQTKKLSDFSSPFLFLQGLIDLFFLTLILHFSGGIENPFLFFYLFHIIIAALLLSKKAAFLQAGYSCLLIALLSFLEYKQIISHYSIGGFLNAELYNNKIYLLALNLVFFFTIMIAAFLSVSITERMRNKEKELLRIREELEKANLNLKEQDRLKSEYVLMVAHNLKSPLAAVKSLTEVITQGYLGGKDTQLDRLLIRISTRIEGMRSFVKDLLNLSRIKSLKQIKKEEFQINVLLKEVKKELSLEAKRRGITIKIKAEDNLPSLKGEREQFKNIFFNLLHNALKYNRKNGDVEIRIVSSVPLRQEGEEKEILIEISDTGIGIPPQDLPCIFEEFYRGSNAKKRAAEGSGLGLSLVKYVIERQGGTIRAASVPGKGSKFFLVLPCK